MKKNILTFILIFSIFVSGCSLYPINETAVSVSHEWTVSELHKYWDTFPTLETLDDALVSSGFKYGNELNDIAYVFDTAPSAEKTMTRGFSNCYGWSRYFADYVKYKAEEKRIYIVKNYEMYLLRDGLSWHYILIFRIINSDDSSTYVEQSNLSFSKNINKQNLLDSWFNKGWRYQTVTERWEAAK